jgi:type I restriction enzyme, S subunit
VSKVDDLIAQLCPDGVEFKTLGEVGELMRGRRFTKADYVDSGLGSIHYGEVYTSFGTWTDQVKSFVRPDLESRLRLARPGDLIIAATGESVEEVGKAVAWLGEGEIAIHDDCYILRHSLDPKFMAYFFQSSAFHLQKARFVTESKLARIAGAGLAAVTIPVPPAGVQRAIVKILDSFEQLEAELGAELELRSRQYAHYRRLLLTFSDEDVRWLTLGDIGRVAMCKRVFKSETKPIGDIPFFKIGTFGGQADAFISQELYEEYCSRYPFPKPGDILLSAAGTIGRAVPYDGKPAYFQDSNIVWVDNDESVVSNAYLLHWYSVITWSTDGGTIRRLYNNNISRARIAVPPRDQQDRIVAILDKFDALVNDLSSGLPAEIAARRKQYEYYRDKLLTFQERTV